MTDKLIVGWREWLHLPELGIKMIKAKVDTGARTSSLHAEEVHILRKGRKDMVSFVVHPKQRSRTRPVEAIAPLVDQRWVRSSNGSQELRPVILTSVNVGGHIWSIELTLTRRDMMGFRMLLGRQAMRGHILVDPSRSFVTRKAKVKVKAPPSAPTADTEPKTQKVRAKNAGSL